MINSTTKNNTNKYKARNSWVSEVFWNLVILKKFCIIKIKLVPNNLNLKDEYKNYKKILKKVFGNAKRLYKKSKVEHVSRNDKLFWQHISNKINKNNSKRNNKI